MSLRRRFLALVGTTVLCVGIGTQCTCSSTPDLQAIDAAAESLQDGLVEASWDRSLDAAPCVPQAPIVQMKAIGPGTFFVGSPLTEFGRGPYDQDQVQVTLTHPFELGATELTQSEWVSLCVPNPSGKDGPLTEDCMDPDCPVGGVTWFDAVAWLNILSEARGLKACYKLNDCKNKIGTNLSCQSVEVLAPSVYECEGYRLPTEFEFEYASRAGTTTAFYSGDITPIPFPDDPDKCIFDPKLDPIGWYCWNSGAITHPVGKKQPNAWGLFDMVGNSLEWTHSKYTAKGYGPVPLTDPPGTSAVIAYGDAPSLRGGIYNFSSRSCRAATRLEASNWGRGAGGGFRVARTLPTSDSGVADSGAE